MLDELELAYDDGETDMRGGRHRRRRTRRGRSIVTLLIVVVLLAVVGGGGYLGVTTVRGWFAVADYAGAGHGTVQVKVETGQTTADIANTLYTKKVVKSAKAFVDAAADNPNATAIQPGVYQLPMQMKASLAVSAMLDLKNRVTSKITIPEGWSTNKILRGLSSTLHKPLSDFQKLVKDPGALGVPDSWFVRDDHKTASKSVEGFLFPDTYQFDPGTSAKDALTEMVQRFMSNATEAGLDKVSGMTPFEALIVASLVQGEGLPKDMPKVARVVYNRLDSTDSSLRYLQFDSTTNYWLDLHGNGAKDSSDLTKSELADTKNPYNTSVNTNAGLPPGPINNPGLAAMKAAAHPASGNWTYFVRIKKDGTSAFTNDYNVQLHNQDVAKQNGAG